MELVRRLRLLDERARLLLVLWFVEGHPAARIAALEIPPPRSRGRV